MPFPGTEKKNSRKTNAQETFMILLLPEDNNTKRHQHKQQNMRERSSP